MVVASPFGGIEAGWLAARWVAGLAGTAVQGEKRACGAVRAAGTQASSWICGLGAGSGLGAGIGFSIVKASSTLVMPRGFSRALGFQVSSPNRQVVSASLPE
ncbi:hypothetical protein [Streptomyces sp. NPDC054849]